MHPEALVTIDPALGATTRPRRGRAVRAAALALATAGPLALAQPVRPIAYAPAAPDRDALRAQILVDERQTQRERLVEARMRLAERIQVGDTAGIEDARRAIARAEDALESLGRELERQPARVAVRPAAPPSSVPIPSALPMQRPPAPFIPPAAPPWWDVYGGDARPRPAAAPPIPLEPAQP